jgi:hypothetical protein
MLTVRARWLTIPSHIVQIAIVKLAIRGFGFATTLRAIRRLANNHVTAAPVAEGEAAEIAQRVARAAAFYPGKALCLEQSMVVYFLLLRRRAPVELRIGVQPHGFRAHAWVEYDGRPVYENGEATRSVVAFPGLGV